jgi:DnaJ homolog subfamily A member 2
LALRQVSLEDLYNGKTVKLAINRKVIVGESSKCTACNGQGIVMEMRQIGPGMITQMQRPCSSCGGQGYSAKTKGERKVIEVHVEKGAHNGQKVTFQGMADEVPGRETGDVNFVIQEKEHALFKRKGADLLIMQDISLNQALTGFSVSVFSTTIGAGTTVLGWPSRSFRFEPVSTHTILLLVSSVASRAQYRFKHLDGRDVIIKTKPGQVIESETKDPDSGRSMPYMMMVPQEGMPSRGNPFVKGNLYVAFHIEFPTTLSPEVAGKLRELLPDPNMEGEYDPMEVEEHFMVQADLRQFGHGGAEASGEDDSDDEGQGGVQCQQS